GGNGAGEDGGDVIEGEAADDERAVATAADEGGEGGGADGPDGGGLDAGQDAHRRQRELDAGQATPAGQAEDVGDLQQLAIERRQTGGRAAHDRQQRVEEQGDEGGQRTDAEQRDHEAEQRQGRDRL